MTASEAVVTYPARDCPLNARNSELLSFTTSDANHIAASLTLAVK